jgi:virginiamycin B lyase
VITLYSVPTPGALGDIVTGPDGALWFTETDADRIGRALVTFGNVTVTTVPAGLTVSVDGTSIVTPRSFNWATGSSHSIAATPAIQGAGADTRYGFASWSDGGTQSHNVTVPSSNITYTATFQPQYLLTTTVTPLVGGSVSTNPASADGFYTSGTSVQLTATANPGFQFLNWNTDLSGGANPQSLTMSGPKNVTANFVVAGQSVNFTEYTLPASASSPSGITAGPDGALWFTEYSANQIGRITTAGAITERPVPTNLSGPQSIATGPDGALWFTEFFGNKIGHITTGGVITEYTVPTSNSGLQFIAAGADGAMWFTENYGNKIGRISTSGAITEYPVPTAAGGPRGITAGPDGAIWFTEINGNKIGRITAAGVVTEYPIPTPNSLPQAITRGPDGALWFCEYLSRIGRITTAGIITEYQTLQLSNPLGITTGPDGALWFTEETGDKIGRITTAGLITEYPLPAAGSGPGSIGSMGPDGALWFAEATGNRIGRGFLPTGVSCTYSLPQAGQAFSPGGGTETAALRAAGNCGWTASSGASWVTITSGSSGTGNGTVSYTVGANSTGAARAGTLTIANQTYTVTQEGNASAVSCIGNVPSVPQVALEGRAELLGDYVLSCSGLTGTVKADITLTLNADVTNAPANAVLTVNGSGAQGGVVAGYNAIRWTGVSLAPAGSGTASVRISGVRADASLSLTQGLVADPGNPQPTAITGRLSVSSAAAILLTGAAQTMANASQTLVFTKNAATGGAQVSIPLVFQEAQAASFQAGVTRLRVSATNLPANVQVYAPVFPAEGARAQLYSADANGVGGSPVSGSPFAGGTYQLLTAIGGTVTATWVVSTADPAVIESFTFAMLAVNPSAADLTTMRVSGSLAPVSDVSSASATAPVPRYRDFSVQPKLANLRVSTSIQATAQSASLKPLIRDKAWSAADAAVTVGSNVTITTRLVNDTTDPAQTATNVVIRDNLPSGLTLVSCSASGGSGCSGSQTNVGTLGPGETATMTVVAQVDASYGGTFVENPASVTSDAVNLDLLASTSSTSFVLLNGVPVAVGSQPPSGTGNSQSFTFQFSHPNGWQNLGIVNILVSNALDARNACYLAYSTQASTLYLVNDAGDAGGPFAGFVALGSSSAIQNSQCSVTLVSASGTGTTLSLTLNMTFKAGFGGNKITYVAARDQSGNNSNWQALGVWQVPWTPSGTISFSSINPARSTGTSGNLQIAFTDSKGPGDIGIVNVLMNNSIDARQPCYLAYVASSNTLYLVDDEGNAGGPFAGSMALNGGNGTIQNGQCQAKAFGSSAQTSGNSLTLNLNMMFFAGFAGNRIVYVASRDQTNGNNTDWQAAGTWTVQ